MHETLKAVVDSATTIIGCLRHKRGPIFNIAKYLIIVTKAALSSQPRNCDRFESEDEMKSAFIAYYNEAFGLKGSMYEISACDLKHDVDGILHDYIQWLFSPAKSETKGEEDGSK